MQGLTDRTATFIKSPKGGIEPYMETIAPSHDLSSVLEGRLLQPRKKVLGRLGERLLADGLISEESLNEALDMQRRDGGFIGEILVSIRAVRPGQIRSYLEDLTGFPFADIAEIEIDRALSTRLPESFVVSKKVLPFREANGEIDVAMADPLDLPVVDELKLIFGKPVVPFLALACDLDEAIKRTFDVQHKTQSVLDEIHIEGLKSPEPIADIAERADEAPIVRLLNGVLSAAISTGASDIHIEPQESNVRVRFRIDGMMYEQMTMPSTHLSPVVSRLKVMSGMDIAERRRPQDGRFSTRAGTSNELDVRLCIMPTVYGEKACMRLLEKSNSLASLDKLGFFPEQRAMFERLVRRPHGLLLVTGPTGSGKSTTLYAALQSINDSTKNINTVEDPVEYKLPGINQMQVNPKIGVTFAAGLRTLVRQDPDVILVGEIRDKETAEIAVQAALTGHLVLSTLHTNDAPGAVVRLRNMGVEPFLVSSAVIGVLGQRLLRTICLDCKETYEPARDEALAAGIPVLPGERPPLVARGTGCRRCGNRGNRGRIAAMELFTISEAVRAMILAGVEGEGLTAQIRREGMRNMRDSAVRKALDLQVSLEEIVRVFADQDGA
jgi:type IV pilus assembly protein PilB